MNKNVQDATNRLEIAKYQGADKLYWKKFLQEERQKARGLWNSNPTNKIANIKKCVVRALKILCAFHGLPHRTLENTEQGQALINVVTSIYLQIWLNTDLSATKNVHSFLSKSNRTQEQHLALWRSVQISNVIRQIEVECAKAENRYYKKESSKICDEKSYGKPISILDLSIAYKSSPANNNSGSLEIIEYLFTGPRPFLIGTKQPRLRESNDRLKECYRQYYALYEDLIPNNTCLSDQDYVIRAIMLQECEYTYRFHAIALLAKAVKENHLELSFRLSDYIWPALLFWGRWANLPEEKPIIIDNPPNDVFEYISFDVLHSPEEVTCLYQIANGQYPHPYLDFHEKNLKLIRDTLLIAINIIPKNKILSWSEKDYSDARQFFEVDYPVYQIYQQACISDGKINWGEVYNKRHDTCYDLIREFISTLINASRENAYNKETLGREDVYAEIKKKRGELRSGKNTTSNE